MWIITEEISINDFIKLKSNTSWISVATTSHFHSSKHEIKHSGLVPVVKQSAKWEFVIVKQKVCYF